MTASWLGTLVADWNAVQWVLALCLLLVGFVGLLVIYTLYLRLSSARAARLAEQVKAQWQPVIFQALFDESVQADFNSTRLPARKVAAFSRLWCSVLEMIEGESHERLRRLGRILNLESALLPLLKQRRFEKRLLAVTCLGYLGGESASHRLQRIIDVETSPVLSLAALKALMKIDQKAGLHWLFAARYQHHWPTERLVEVLEQVDQRRAIAAVKRAMSIERIERLPDLLKLLAGVHAHLSEEEIRVLADEYSASPDVISHLLPLVNHAPLHDWVRAMLAHADVRVRIQAARTMKRVGRKDDLPALVPLLKDRDWWARYRAMQAIWSLPGVSPDRVGSEVAALKDQFARDILRHVAQENHWRREARWTR